MNSLCKCGCGKEVTINQNNHLPNMFIKGHNSRTKETKEKKRLSSLEKFGVDYPMQAKEVREKFIQSCFLKYGVTNPSKVDTIQKKKIQSNLENFGFESSNQSEEIKEKKRKTCLEHYGVTNPLKSKDIRDKVRTTNIKKYGIYDFSKTLIGKQICRINAIKHIEIQKLSGEPLCPRIGDQERSFLNELQQYTSYKIIKNDKSFRYVIGRFPDGHIQELKLFIQFDERFHFEDYECTIYKQDDIDCTLQLASLGYIVFRVSEKDWGNNKDIILNKFKILLMLLEQNKKYLLNEELI